MTGSTGATGSQGPAGPTGAPGAVGPQGPAGDSGQVRVRKAPRTSTASDTSVNDDPHLLVAVGTNEIWDVEAFIIATSSSSTPDIKITFNVPTGATIIWTSEKQKGTGVTISNLVTTSADEENFSIAANATIIFRVKGTVSTTATSGNLMFRGAQNSCNGTATQVLVNSWMKSTKF